MTQAVNKSSPPDVFCKKGVLRNFAEFTGKYLCQSLFFNKVAGLRPETLLKKRLTLLFSCEICEFLRIPFLIEYLQWLLLSKQKSIHLLIDFYFLTKFFES